MDYSKANGENQAFFSKSGAAFSRAVFLVAQRVNIHYI
jgi:hypothetical protein